jgi:mono/diheme cytochrome c family protein
MKTKHTFIALALCLLVFSQCNNSKPPEAATPAEATSSTEAAKPYYGGFASQAEWGQHIVTVGGCNDCHTPKKMTDHGPVLDSSMMLAGHPAKMPPININRKEIQSKGFVLTQDLTEWIGPWGTSYAANLTPDPTGTGGWKEEQLFLALREGKSKGLPNSRQILPPMPWEMFKYMTDDEIKAIWAYLRTIPPVSNVVPAPLPPEGK